MSTVSDLTVQVSGLTAALPAPQATGDAVQRETSAYDIAAFRDSMAKAQTVNQDVTTHATTTEPAESAGLRAVFSTLDTLNGRAEVLEAKSAVFSSGDRDMTPGDMLMLTVESHEFLFHCELTANVANRTSDGIQQLFRQQS